jgi:inner membrane protein
MDPIAHTFTGAALAASGLRRATPLATAALLIGANVPDVDVMASFGDSFTALALRRGWTHGVLALAIWPFIVTGLLLWWARLRPRYAHDPPRASRLLAVAALAVLTHPFLDWLNNYGLRWLMPFDGRWFYGDALFIVDPWVWLALGGAAYLRYSQGRLPLICWALFWSGGTILVLTTELPIWSVLLWLGGLVVVLIARLQGYGRDSGEPKLDRVARAALLGAAIYIAASLAGNIPARVQIAQDLALSHVENVTDIMLAPLPGDPFAGFVVVATADAYRLGDWHWFAAPRFRLRDTPIHKNMDNPIVTAASRTNEAVDFLTWSRYPYAVIETDTRGHTVHLRDARYADLGRLAGPSIRFEHALNASGDSQ